MLRDLTDDVLVLRGNGETVNLAAEQGERKKPEYRARKPRPEHPCRKA